MTDGHPPAGFPIVLDSSALIAYERLQAPSGALRQGQSWISRWLVDGVTLVVPALSLTIAFHVCGGKIPELEFLLGGGDADQILVVPLAETSAVHVGTAAASVSGDDLEVAQVLWCATGGDSATDGGAGGAGRWQVATYLPQAYAGKDVPLIHL